MWGALKEVHMQKRPGTRFNAYDDLCSIRKREEEGPNTLGNVVHHSAYIESLLHIASSYVHHPLGTYSQILRRLHPNFDPFGDYQLTCVCLECNHLDSNGEEETDELMSDWSDIAEESSGNTISTSSSIESLAILRPQSAPPELPSSPRT